MNGVSRTTLIGLALLIFAGTLWLYWPAVNGGFLTRMDDDEYLREAVRLSGLTWNAVRWAFTTTQPYYHPLPRLSLVLDYQLWGTDAQWYHATNIVLHALNAALVFGFLWTLLGAVASLATSERLALAFGVTAVFAIHPLQVESVAWISVRSQLLCTAFGIGCVWAYVTGARRWLVSVLFAVALLCKPTAVSLFFAMLAMDCFPLGRHERLGWGRLLREKTVLIALAAAAAVATLFTESRAGGLMEPLEAVRPLQRVFLAAQSLTFYPWKLVWPAWLSSYYPLHLGFSLRPLLVAASALAVAAVTALGIWRWRRTPALLASWGAYVMFVLPVSGLTLRGWQAAADRYAYVAILPLVLLAGGAVVWLWRRGPMVVRFPLVCLLAAELGFFGCRTRAQTAVWRNDETLWRGVLAVFPDSAVANEMLAQALLNQNRIGEALACAQRAVRSEPSAETHRNLGIVLTRAGRVQEAIEEFDRSLQLKPDLADAHHNLALALMGLGRTTEAIGQWEQALRINPNFADAHCNLGIALQRAGRMGEAIGHYEQALRIDPDYAEARFNLGVALVRLGRLPEAISQWEQTLRLHPDYAEAHANLGVALEHEGRIEEAIKHYEQALRIKPGLVEARYNFGVALMRLGRVHEAIEQWDQVVQLKPDMAAAHYNLGVALEQEGKREDAIGQYEQAMRLQPDYAAAQGRLAGLRALH
ncbi:MAG TPA: tetratricopeptide repeat protein [Verrucomicrobiae bacterium]|nr:tetratricopeptide repeat protein [Verrucomicrobiae bacterium]